MKYACQNATKELLDHMYPVPEYFKVDPQYLRGLDEIEFIDGFRCLWNALRDMYKDIIEDPESWGLPCSEDTLYGEENYNGFDKKRADSGNSSRRLMDYLKTLCQIGEIKEGRLVIPYEAYIERLKAGKTNIENTAAGITNAASGALINRLTFFGFNFTGFNGKAFDKDIARFEVSYDDNKNLIPALKGYCMTSYRRGKFAICQYIAVAATGTIPEPVCAFTFSQYFIGQQREFFNKFNSKMLAEGANAA